MSLKERFANWSRFQTILACLAKHGLSGLLFEAGLTSGKAPSKETDVDDRRLAAQLRLAAEELGPTFVKLGQLLSTRPDILPEAYIQEFSKLTDSVPPFEFSEVKLILEREFGEPVDQLFSQLDPRPLAAASIAQVHAAQVRETGEQIVLKIQRPGINKTVQTDIQILYRLASAIERLRDDFKLLNLTAIVREFQRSINEELDFTLEARNMDFFARNMSGHEGVIFPHPLWTFTTKKVLAMNKMEGIALAQLKEIPSGVDRHFLVESIVTFFFESIFYHGIFHADAHAGNLLLQSEGRGRLVLLDFGLCGTLGSDLRGKLSKIFLALVSQDFESLAQTYVEIGDFGRRFSVRDFTNDIKDFLRPQLGRPLKEIQLGELLLDSTRIARKYQVRVPRDLILFYRSIITLEAIGRKLDPDFEFMAYGQKFAKNLVRRRFTSDELLKDLFKTFDGLRSLGTELPSQVRHIVQRLESSEGGLGFSQEALVQSLKKMSLIQNLSSLTGLSFVGSAVLSALRPGHFFEVPAWIISTLLLGTLLFVFLKPTK